MNIQYLSKILADVIDDDENDELEIDSELISRLIKWLRKIGCTDTQIVDCIEYICTDEDEEEE